MQDLGPALVLMALIGFIGFQQWLRHSRRTMIHRERLAALDKGLELPPLEQEVQRGSWNVQRILLLAGLCWISLGFGAFMVLNALLAHPSELVKDIPQGLQFIGVAPVGIGLSHLIVYLVEKKKER
ncbi:MAG: hypothetical protein EHM23_27885 [Acidobacteria bacterium]|nr:MAG: hypothetical protein EHM23_27885 [Acidobacteriota bacterium]